MIDAEFASLARSDTYATVGIGVERTRNAQYETVLFWALNRANGPAKFSTRHFRELQRNGLFWTTVRVADRDSPQGHKLHEADVEKETSGVIK